MCACTSTFFLTAHIYACSCVCVSLYASMYGCRYTWVSMYGAWRLTPQITNVRNQPYFTLHGGIFSVSVLAQSKSSFDIFKYSCILCIYVCIHVCMSVCMYKHAHVYKRRNLRGLHTCSMYVFICASTTCMRTQTRMSVHRHRNITVHPNTRTCFHTHTHTHTH